VEHRPSGNPARPTDGASFRIAAIGDLHLKTAVPHAMAEELASLDQSVDMLVIAGDITESGRLPEVELACELLADIRIPIIAVLGNHDRRGVRRRAMRLLLEQAGVRLLDGSSMVHVCPNGRIIGLAGVGGYGGGFWPEEAPDHLSTRLSKAVGVRARREALRLQTALDDLSLQESDAVVVVMHYSPTVSTLGEEPPLKHWMLGNSLLGRVIDDHRVDLVIHGHAHLGNEYGQTPGGTPVRNVAFSVTGGPVVYEVRPDQSVVTASWPAGLSSVDVAVDAPVPIGQIR
jgi:Icc-related predicted phosphoesterase